MLDFNLLGVGGLNPLQMATQGYAQGLQISQAEQQIQAQREAAQLAQQQAQQEQELLNRAMGGDIQARTEYVLTKFAKDGKQAQEAFSMLDEPRKKEAQNIATQLYTLSETNPQLAREFVKGKITAYENTPNLTPEQQQDLAYYKTMDLVDDDALPYFAGNMVALAMGEDGYKKLAESIESRKEQPLKMREQAAKATTAEAEAKFAPQKQLVDIQNKQSEIERRLAQTNDENERRQLEAQKIELDRQKLYIQASQRENKPLSAGAQKIADQFSTDAVAAVNNAATARQLVSELKQIDPNMFERGAGWSGALSVVGGQYQEWLDSYSQMRKKIIGTNKDVVGGGVLSDSDMKLMREGIPEGTAEPKRVIKFMEDFAKVQDKVAVFDDMRANWMQQNGNMGKLKEPLELSNGDVVPAGTTVTEAARMFRSGKIGGSVESKTIVPVNDAISQLVAAGYTEQEARKLVGGK